MVVSGTGAEKSARGDRARRLIREFVAALLFFATGVAFLLLQSLGPVYLGPSFNGGSLQWIGTGLIIVAVYVTVGVNLPRLLSGRTQVRRDDDTDDEES